MRNIPYYQEIIVTEENLPSIKKVLQEVDNRFSPYLINVLELEGGAPIMSSIQKYLELKISDFNLPYPIYFLSKKILKGSSIKTFQRKRDVPQFYFHKEKRPTRIHAQISRLNISAEKTLEYDDRELGHDKIRKYAKNNRQVHLLNLRNQYYKKILNNLKVSHAKKTPKQNLLDLLEGNDKETPNPLAGFEDFIQSHNIHIHKNSSLDKSDEGRIQTFLVNNYQRISKIAQLFQQKLAMLEKFDQTEQTIKNLEIENEVFLEKIIKKSLPVESPLNRSLTAIFNSHFKEID